LPVDSFNYTVLFIHTLGSSDVLLNGQRYIHEGYNAVGFVCPDEMGLSTVEQQPGGCRGSSSYLHAQERWPTAVENRRIILEVVKKFYRASTGFVIELVLVGL